MILKLKKQIKDYLSNLRTDETLFFRVLEQLEKEQNVLENTGFMRFDGNYINNLECLLEYFAGKKITFPHMIGCALPFKFLEEVEKWFIYDDLLNNLNTKRDHACCCFYCVKTKAQDQALRC